MPYAGTVPMVHPATGLSGISSVMSFSGAGEVGSRLQAYAGNGSFFH